MIYLERLSETSRIDKDISAGAASAKKPCKKLSKSEGVR